MGGLNGGGLQVIDASSNRSAAVDFQGNLLTADVRRLLGSNSLSITGSPADLWVSSLATGTGTATGTSATANFVTTLDTTTTANASILIRAISPHRFNFGKVNKLRAFSRFVTAGTTGNVREIGLWVDANNSLGFRLSGSTFSVFTRLAGTDTVVASGSFNGNGTGQGQSYTLDQLFHGFEIDYYATKIQFLIDGVPIHTIVPTTGALISSLVGSLYHLNNNTASSTSVQLQNNGAGVFSKGDTVNNPISYFANAIGSVVLKANGGTLHSLMIGSTAGLSNARLELFDSNTTSTAGAKQLFYVDTNNAGALGPYQFAEQGINFNNGLLLVVTTAAANAVILFE